MPEGRSVVKGETGISEHDKLFKQLLEEFFLEFVELFYPKISKLIDRNHLNFLKQEIITDVVDMDKHIVDIIVETKLADEDGLVLIHVESQAQRVPDYNRMLFKYFARLHEKHQRKIIPLVVYSHDAKIHEPDSYKVEFSFLKVLEFNFLMLQLKKEPWRKYIKSNNPVAAALISKMDYTDEEKITLKIEFSRMMANMSLDMARSTMLTAFFETYVKLTEEEEVIYRDRLKTELNQQEVEKLIELTTSYHEKGREEGRKEGKKEIAKKLLAKNMPIEEVVEITELSREQVEKLKK